MGKARVVGCTAAVAVLGCLGLCWAGPTVNAQRTASSASVGTSEMIAFPVALPEGGQQLTVIDPVSRALCVYAIDASGAITLKSVRNIHWDLQLLEFNGTAPRPQEIRAMIPTRQP